MNVFVVYISDKETYVHYVWLPRRNAGWSLVNNSGGAKVLLGEMANVSFTLQQ